MSEDKETNPVFEMLYLQLPPGYNGRAIANHRNQQRGIGCHATTLAAAIDSGIHWARTPEGHEFWSRVCSAARRGDFDDLPPLPEDKDDA